MSTEKLSELSKPVFEIEVSGGHWLNCTSGKLTPDTGADFSDWPDGVNRLYSQEYVSALLAELEAKDKRILELDYLRLSACEVFKEIGNELGCNPDNESNMMAIDALKERLATPVRLPKTNGYWTEQEKAFEDAIILAKREVRLAGFTVEGDE